MPRIVLTSSQSPKNQTIILYMPRADEDEFYAVAARSALPEDVPQGAGPQAPGIPAQGPEEPPSWPLDDIAKTNIVWCMAYIRGVGGASYIAQ